MSDKDPLFKAAAEQLTGATALPFYTVERSDSEKEASARKIEVDTEKAKEELFKIKLKRRFEGVLIGLILGIILTLFFI